MDFFSQFGQGQKKEKVPRKKAIKELWSKIYYTVGISSFLLIIPNLAPQISPKVESITGSIQNVANDGINGVSSFLGHYAKKVETAFQDGLVYLFS